MGSKKSGGRTRSAGGRSQSAAVNPHVSLGEGLFQDSSGRWAGQRMAAASAAGHEITPGLLKTADTLRVYEWIEFDRVVLEETVIRLRAVGDLISRGLVKPVTNAMGKTFLNYEKASYMTPATTSMDGLANSGGDRQEFSPHLVPLPITHKDFFINLRQLAASRNLGESLDMTETRVAGRVVAEQIENMFFNGGPQFGGSLIYGVTTEPNINGGTFNNGEWSTLIGNASAGIYILSDVLEAIAALQADRFFGPYAIYVGTAQGPVLEDDFKTYGTISIRQRLLQIENVVSVQVCDQMPVNKVVIMQLTEDVACIVDGIPPQTIQWDVDGGMKVNFKVMAIQVPLIRSTKAGRSGIYIKHT
jgi:hypothetical protein